MVNGYLEPNHDGSIVVRIFELRSEGKSYPEIERVTGVKYSTVRQVCHNRVYVGETKLRNEWYPGVHQPLVTPELFDAAQKGNLRGVRIGHDLLSGRVECGMCRKRIAIDSNGRNQGIYRCKHRGQGCAVPGRSAAGLARAAALAFRELAEDRRLLDAIRFEIERRYAGTLTAEPSRAADAAQLARKRQKLLDLWYADKISAELFAEQEQSLTAKIRVLEEAATEQLKAIEHGHRVLAQFERVASMLQNLDIEAIWNTATDRERRTLLKELVDAVVIHDDRIEVRLHQTPAITVLFSEVGLREGSGTRPSVSEGGLVPLPHVLEFLASSRPRHEVGRSPPR